MKDIEKTGKSAAIILAVLYLVFFREQVWFEWLVFGLVLTTVGIPHGALDHLIPHKVSGKTSLSTFLIQYLGIMAAYLLAWYFFPVLSLIFFIIISAYHFGQTHFLNKKIVKLKTLSYFSLGSNFLLIILLSDFTATKNILSSILDIGFIGPYTNPILVFVFISGIVVLAFQPGIKQDMIEYLVLSALLYFTPLILSFGLYFGFWHALPSLKTEYQFLSKNVRKNKIQNFLRLIWPFSTLSIFGILVILLFSKSYLDEEALVLLFFVMVSLISAPHIFVMHHFFETGRTQN